LLTIDDDKHYILTKRISVTIKMKSILLLWTTRALFLLQFSSLSSSFTYTVAPTATYINSESLSYTAHIVERNRNQPFLAGSINDDEITDISDNDFNPFEDMYDISSTSTPDVPIFYTEEDEIDCLPPGRTPITKMVMLVSDSTGQTVKAAFGKSLAQFETCDDPNSYVGGDSIGDCNVQTRQFTFIRSEAALASIIKMAAVKKALVMFTFADPALKLQAERMCELSNVPTVDLLSPTLGALSDLLGKAPLGLQGMIGNNRGGSTGGGVKLSDSYYRRIEAMEFTLKADDGQSPWLLPEAEVILVGVSRTGKTPLSVVLSQATGLKVANIPLVMECEPPELLLKAGAVDSKRVFCLTIAPSELRKIRTVRLERQFESSESKSTSKSNTMAHTSNYADRAYLLNDLKHARNLAEAYGWTEIDVTGRAVEETASYITEIMSGRFGKEMHSGAL